jgi:hypothetical protein
LVETLARTKLPATDTAVANSLSRAQSVASAVDTFRWDRLEPLRAAENQADERGRAAARTLARLREAAGSDEFATRLGRVLSETDDAIFDWLKPDPKPSHGGRATRTKGGPDNAVFEPLGEFLKAHRGDQVIVEWRVQE